MSWTYYKPLSNVRYHRSGLVVHVGTCFSIAPAGSPLVSRGAPHRAPSCVFAPGDSMIRIGWPDDHGGAVQVD